MGGQEVIVQLGDRRNSGFCLACGTTLIQPWNDYQCCSNCTRSIQESLHQFELKRRKQKSVGSRMVKSEQILRQITPVGVLVE